MTTDQAAAPTARLRSRPPEFEPRRGAGALDPFGLLTVVAAAFVFLTRGWDGILSRDLALYAYAGQRVADGEPPYVGVMNRSGPLAHLVPGLGAWLGRVLGLSESGADDLLAERVLFLVLSLALVWCVYLLVRDVLDSRLAGLAATVALVMNPGIITYATGGPREKTTMLLLLTLMLLACRHHRFGWAGVLLALATLTWQPVFFPGIVAAVGCALLLGPGSRRAALVRIVAGGLVTGAVFAGYFAIVGALRDAVDGFLVIHLHYTRQAGIVSHPGQVWRELVEAFGVSTYVLCAGLAAVLVAAPVLWARRRQTTVDRSFLVFSVATLAGLLWSYRVFNGWADALVLFPFAALGIGAIVVALGRVPLRLGRAATVVALCLGLVGGYQAAADKSMSVLPDEQAEVERVFEILPNASIWAIEAPQPLVLGRRVNASQHQMFRNGIERFVADEYGGLRAYADLIHEQRPTLIAVGYGAHYGWLRPVLDDYERVGTSPGWSWYVTDRVDPGVRERLVDAVRG